jgi:Ca-activated chloride channel family protein
VWAVGVWRGAALAVAASFVSVGAAAQVHPAHPTLTFSARADRVLLSATALDKKGRPVQNLKAQEFRIFEEGKPQALAHFSAAEDLPARILLLVDASGSMNVEQKVASVKMAVTQLLAALAPDDMVAMAGFDSRYFGVVPFTKDRAAILDALKEVSPWGTTALHDGLEHAAKDLASHGEGRRAVVVLTDGLDNASETSPEDAIASTSALEVPIYPVTVLSPIDDASSSMYVGKETPTATGEGAALLKRYALLSGGESFTASDLLGIQLAAKKIASELKHQYRLGYDPPDGPMRFRHVEVRTTRKGTRVKTRSGYMPRS